MPEFFFPASGVGFSQLYNFSFNSCHEFVNSFVHCKLMLAAIFIKHKFITQICSNTCGKNGK
jgi:hypothetical protein